MRLELLIILAGTLISGLHWPDLNCHHGSKWGSPEEITELNYYCDNYQEICLKVCVLNETNIITRTEQIWHTSEANLKEFLIETLAWDRKFLETHVPQQEWDEINRTSTKVYNEVLDCGQQIKTDTSYTLHPPCDAWKDYIDCVDQALNCKPLPSNYDYTEGPINSNEFDEEITT